MKILFIGDIVGKISRQAVEKILPKLIKTHKPDLVVANAENLAHGKGVNRKSLDQMKNAGIDVFTSGNHITKKGGYQEILDDPHYNILRPANYPPGLAGKEYLDLKVNKRRLVVINLLGRVFFNEDFDCPFRKFNQIYKLLKLKKSDILIVDFHAEATSEKVAFGWFADGRASAILGTHTHISTADETILPKGTAYITDVGMVGPEDSVLGVNKDIIIEKFLSQTSTRHELIETGQVVFNSVLVEFAKNSNKATKIKRIKRKQKV